jgi:hypothetical protein
MIISRFDKELQSAWQKREGLVKNKVKEFLKDSTDEKKNAVAKACTEWAGDIAAINKRFYPQAYKLGKQALGGETVLTAQDIKELNKQYKDSAGYATKFADEVSALIGDIISTKFAVHKQDEEEEPETPTTPAILAAVAGVFSSNIRRVSLYAIHGTMGSYIAGWSNTAKGLGVTHGYWRTAGDRNVCHDCQDHDGRHMTLEEFADTWGTLACDGACRCELEEDTSTL